MATARKQTKTTAKPKAAPSVKAPVKKTQPKSASAQNTVKKEAFKSTVSGMTVSVVDMNGKEKGTVTLPEEFFAQKMNDQLVSQAVRIYLANQRKNGAHTKTRGEVEGSTRKIYRQKGTGRARHGGIRAPIFVGGGIAFGPRRHEFTLTMPAKMKKKALSCALSAQLKRGKVIVVDGMGQAEPKTKTFATLLSALGCTGSTFVVLSDEAKSVSRAIRNISNVTFAPVSTVTTYDIVSNSAIVFMKESIAQLKKVAA